MVFKVHTLAVHCTVLIHALHITTLFEDLNLNVMHSNTLNGTKLPQITINFDSRSALVLIEANAQKL